MNLSSLDISDTKVSSFLDHEYKSSISYNVSDLIYINQGDIVNYFENNSLKDLVTESGEIEKYKEAIEFFKSRKQHLINQITKLIDLYSELNDTLRSNFTLHNRDIKSILDPSYFFRLIGNIEDKSDSFEVSDKIIHELLINTEDFKLNNNWSFTTEEQSLITEFKILVESKKTNFEKTKSAYEDKMNFIVQVNKIISAKNSNLDLRGREKEASNQRLTLLKAQIESVFESSKRVEEHCSEFEKYIYGTIQEIKINDNVTVVLEVENQEDIKSKIVEGLNLNGHENSSLYIILVQLVLGVVKVKNYTDNSADNFRKKINTQLKPILESFDQPVEYLKYSEESTSKNNSPGYNSEKYLDTILRTGNSKIVFIDQPEDNLGNRFITENLIDLIRDLKFKKQIFLVTHNPSIVVYGDAENIIMCVNNENTISYEQFVLEEKEHQKEICNILDGGHYIFEQRARKYNIKKIIQS